MMPITASDTVALQLEVMREPIRQMWERDVELLKLYGPLRPYTPPEPKPAVREMAMLLGATDMFYASAQDALEKFVEFCNENLSDWRTNPQTTVLWKAFEAGAETARYYDYEADL